MQLTAAGKVVTTTVLLLIIVAAVVAVAGWGQVSHDPWVWAGALLTLAIFTFLYKDNPMYKFAEHLMVGLSMGYGLALIYHRWFLARIYEPLKADPTGEWLLYPCIVVGILYFFQFVPRLRWLVRYPLGITMGVAAGLSIPLTIQAQLFVQIRHTMLPLWGADWKTAWLGTYFINFLIILGVVTCLIYFFFSVRHVGVVGIASRIGIIFLMIGFGASFGCTVMARVSLLIMRTQFVLVDWLGLPVIR